MCLERDFGKINAIRSTKAARIPTVMSKAEVTRVFEHLSGVYLLIALYLKSRPSPLNPLSPGAGRCGLATIRMHAAESEGYRLRSRFD